MSVSSTDIPSTYRKMTQSNRWATKFLLPVIETGHPLNAMEALIVASARKRYREEVIQALKARLTNWCYRIQVDGALLSQFVEQFIHLDPSQARKWIKERLCQLESLHIGSGSPEHVKESDILQVRTLCRSLCALGQIEDAHQAVKLTGSNSPEIRHCAADGLKHFAQGRQPFAGYDPTIEKEIVNALKTLLKDESEGVRMVAASSLGSFASEGATYAKALTLALKDQDEKVRIAAASAIRGFSSHWDIIRPALRQAFVYFTNCSSDLSDAVANTLSAIGGSAAQEELILCYYDGLLCTNGFLASKCARQLAESRNCEHIAKLGQALLSEIDWGWSEPQSSFARALTKLADLQQGRANENEQSARFEQVVDIFIAALSHKNIDTRCAAALGLQALGIERVLKKVHQEVAASPNLLGSILMSLPAEKPKERCY